MRKYSILILLLFLSLPGFAQGGGGEGGDNGAGGGGATVATGTIIDVNGNPYANGTVSVYYLPDAGAGAPFTINSTTNASGAFSVTVPRSGAYQFTVCAMPVSIGPLANPTPTQVCVYSSPIKLSGAGQDVSAQINAVAPILGPRTPNNFNLLSPPPIGTTTPNIGQFDPLNVPNIASIGTNGGSGQQAMIFNDDINGICADFRPDPTKQNELDFVFGIPCLFPSNSLVPVNLMRQGDNITTCNLNGIIFVGGFCTGIFPDLPSAVTACGGVSCTIDIASFITVSATYVVPSYVNFRYDGGIITILGGATLTINGSIQGPPTQIFNVQGALVLGGMITQPKVEWFGAVGDWNGSTGTDNTAAMQACFDALTVGQCVMQGLAYKTTNTLTITRSGIGLIGVDETYINSGLAAAGQPGTTLVVAAANPDAIDVTGPAGNNNATGNVFKNFSITRTTIPGATTKGISLVNAFDTIIDRVSIWDSQYCFYFHGAGSGGTGYIANSLCAWGFNGVTETTGNLIGFYADATGGTINPSLRLRNNHVAGNLGHSAGGVWTTYGYYNNGVTTSDWHLLHDESALVDYGIFEFGTGVSVSSAVDLQMIDIINDGCYISCYLITGVDGAVSIIGGWNGGLSTSTGPVFDIESSNNTLISGSQIYFSGSTNGGVLAHNSSMIRVIGNVFWQGASTAIKFDTSNGGVVSGNTIAGVNTTTLISYINSSNIATSNNVMDFTTATNGILLDSNSHGISGLETNTCGIHGGSVTNCVVDNAGNFMQLVVGTVGQLGTCNAGSEGAERAVTNANALTYGAAVTPAGTAHVIAYCNGTAWVAH